MIDIKKWVYRIENIMVAVTFAEAGQRDMALAALSQKSRKKRLVSRNKKRPDNRPVLRV